MFDEDQITTEGDSDGQRTLVAREGNFPEQKERP